jgi:hypothetical protein
VLGLSKPFCFFLVLLEHRQSRLDHGGPQHQRRPGRLLRGAVGWIAPEKVKLVEDAVIAACGRGLKLQNRKVIAQAIVCRLRAGAAV